MPAAPTVSVYVADPAAGYRHIDAAHIFIARAHADWLLRADVNVGIFALESGRLLGGVGLHIRDRHVYALTRADLPGQRA